MYLFGQGKQAGRQSCSAAGRQAGRKSCRQAGSLAGRQTVLQAGRQAVQQAGKQAGIFIYYRHPWPTNSGGFYVPHLL